MACSGTTPVFTGSPNPIDVTLNGNLATIVLQIKGDNTSTNFTVGVYRAKGADPTFLASEKVASRTITFGTPTAEFAAFSLTNSILDHSQAGDFHYRARIECEGNDFGGETTAAEIVRVPFFAGSECVVSMSGLTVTATLTVNRDSTSAGFDVGLYRKLGSTPTFAASEKVNEAAINTSGSGSYDITLKDTINEAGTWHYAAKVESTGGPYTGADQSTSDSVPVPTFTGSELTAVRSGSSIVVTARVLPNADVTNWYVAFYRKKNSAPLLVASEFLTRRLIAAGGAATDYQVTDVPPSAGSWYYKARIETDAGAITSGDESSTASDTIPQGPVHVVEPGVEEKDTTTTTIEDTRQPVIPARPPNILSHEGVDEHIVLVKVTGTPASGLTFTDVQYLDAAYQRMEWWYGRNGGCGKFRLHLREEFTYQDQALDNGWEIHVRIRLNGESGYTTWYRGVIRSVSTDRSGNEILTEIRGYGYVEQMNLIQVQKKYPAGWTVSQVVNDIVDVFLKPHSRIIRPIDVEPTDNTGVDNSPYVLQGDVHFECSALKALKFLAELQHNREFGVDARRGFYFRDNSATTVIRNFFTDRDSIKTIAGGKAFSKVNQVKVEGKQFTGREFLRIRTDITDVTNFGLFEKPMEIPWVTDTRDADRWADNLITTFKNREPWKTFIWQGVNQRLESSHPMGRIQFFGPDPSNTVDELKVNKIKYIKGGFHRRSSLMEIGDTVQQTPVHQPVLTATVYAGGWRKDEIEYLEEEILAPLKALEGKLRQFRNPDHGPVLPSEGRVYGEVFALDDPTSGKVVPHYWDASEWIPQQHARKVSALPTQGRFVGEQVMNVSSALHYWNGSSWISVASGAGANFAAGVSNLGNTAGNTGTRSSGTVVLAGGNQITVSQGTNANGATITVSGRDAVFGGGVSNLGNTLGDTGTRSGTLVFAAAGVVTLSQATAAGGATVTVSVPAAAGVTAVTAIGVSDVGNTSGNTGVTNGTYVLAGGNHITLSQATATGSRATVTVSGRDAVFGLGVSNVGNTAGQTGTTWGTIRLRGGANITLDQATQSNQSTAEIRIDGPNAVFGLGVSTIGNTSGQTGTRTGTIVLVGGNNITLSQDGGGGVGSQITISGRNAVFGAGVSTDGNTAGSTGTTVGTLVFVAPNANDIPVSLSQSTDANGATVSWYNRATGGTYAEDIGSASAAGANNQRWAREAHIHRGIGAAGISNVGNTDGTSGSNYGTLVLAGGDNVTLSQSLPGGANAGQIRVTVSGRNAVFGAGISNLGNTSGNSGTRSGTFVLAGGNNVTVSQATNANGGTVTISVPDGATATGNFGAIAAGTQTATSGTVVLSDSNGISFGMSGSSRVTATFAAIKSLSGGTTRATNGEVVFSDSNGVSFGVNGNTITASVSQGGVAVAGGTQTASTGTVVFSDSNGISFGLSGSSRMTATFAGIKSVSGGTTRATNGEVVFSNSNQISFGVDGNTITATFAGIKSISGGTTRATNGEVVFSNSNGLTFGVDGNTVTASVSREPSIAAGTQTASTGTVVFANSNRVTFGMSGSSQITASMDLGLERLGVSNVGNTAGNTGTRSGTVILAGGNNITVSQATDLLSNQATITISGPNAIFGGGVSNVGNTAGDTGTRTGTVVFRGGNSITLSQSTAALTPGVFTIEVQGAGIGLAAGTQTGTTGTIVFSDSNGVSFGMSGSTRVTASVSREPSLAAGTQTGSSGTIVFSDSNGISFGMSGSTRVTATFAGIKSISGGTTRATNGEVVFSNSNGISFGVDGNTVTASVGVNSISSATTASQVTTANVIGANAGRYALEGHQHAGVAAAGVSTDGNTAGSTGTRFGTLVLVAPNAGDFPVRLSQSTNDNGATVSWNVLASNATRMDDVSNESALGGAVQRWAAEGHIHRGVGAAGISNVGNTAGTSGSTYGTLVLVGGNNITVSQSLPGGGAAGQIRVTISAPNQTGLEAVAAGTQTATSGTALFSDSNGISFGMSGSSRITATFAGIKSISGGTTRATNGEVVFSNANQISFGVDGNTVTATFAAIKSASAGTTRVTNGEVVFSNSNNVSFGANGNTITASASGLGIASLSAGTTRHTSGEVEFRDSNGISFGASVSTTLIGNNTQIITASFSREPYLAAGTQTASTGTVVFSDSNGISFGMSGSSRVTATFAGIKSLSGGTTRATNGEVIFSNSNQISFGVDGNTVTATFAGIKSVSGGTTRATNGEVVFSNSNGVSFGVNGNTVTASVPVETPFGLSAGTQSVSTGTLVFSDSNGISFGMSGSSRVTATFAGIKSISGGTTRATNGEVVFSNSNGVTFGVDGNTVTASVPTETPFGVSAGTQSVSTGTLVFSNSNAITFGMSGSSRVTASVLANSISSATTASQVSTANVVGADAGRYALEGHQHAGLAAGGVSNVGNTAGDTGTRFGTLVFAGGAGIVASQATGANTNTISIVNSWSTGTTASGVTTANVVGADAGRFAMEGHQHAGVAAVGISGGNTAGDTGTRYGTILLAGGAGIILSGATGANTNTVSVVNSWSTATTASQVHSVNEVGANAGRFAMEGHRHAGIAAMGVSTEGNTLGDTGTKYGTFVFKAGQNITMSQITSNNGQNTILIDGASTAAAAVAVAAGTQTAISGTVVFSDSNQISFGMSGSTRVTATFAAIKSVSAGTTRATNGEVILSNSNQISFGIDGGTVTATFAAIKSISGGTTRATNGEVVFSNSNGVTFGLNGGTMTASVSQAKISGIFPYPFQSLQSLNSETAGGPNLNVLSLQPMTVPCHMTASRFHWPMGLQSHVGANSSSGSAGTYQLSVGIYTQTGSTVTLATSASTQYTYTTNNTATTASSVRGAHKLYQFRSLTGDFQFTPGTYWIGLHVTHAEVNASSNATNFSYGIHVPLLHPDVQGTLFNDEWIKAPYPGIHSAGSFTSAMPGSFGITDIQRSELRIRTQMAGWAFIGSYN